jgi:hypothetical protein
LHRAPYAILDDEGRIIAALAGRPYSDGEAGSWDGVTARACAAIEAARPRMNFNEEDLNHRRGPHVGKPYGWSHGQGQQVWLWELLHHTSPDWFIQIASNEAQAIRRQRGGMGSAAREQRHSAHLRLW